MTPRATLSPAWLGLFALTTFGGLVLATDNDGKAPDVVVIMGAGQSTR